MRWRVPQELAEEVLGRKPLLPAGPPHRHQHRPRAGPRPSAAATPDVAQDDAEAMARSARQCVASRPGRRGAFRGIIVYPAAGSVELGREAEAAVDEVRLRPVTFAQLSDLRHETFTSEERPFDTPEFLVIRYFGAYRDGSAGRGDALYIVATAEAARTAWYSHFTLLDFRDLQYAWGDEMEWVTSIGWDRVIQGREPLGIVVGEKCRAALKSLLRDEYETLCADTIEQALALCRRQEQEYKQRLKEHRERA